MERRSHSSFARVRADLRRVVWLALIVAGLAWPVQPPSAQTGNGREAVIIGIDGAIGPASADYFVRGLAKARERGAAIVVLRMDTPGAT